MAGISGFNDFAMKNNTYLRENYKICSTIKNTHSGALIKIQHLQSGEKRLLKAIPKYHLKTNGAELEIISEVNAMLKLDHPCICKIYEFFQDSSNYYLITERFLGNDLVSRVISRKEHSETLCSNYIAQICSCLNNLKERNIIHRHITPNNFIFNDTTGDGVLKLVNFRLSVVLAPGISTSLN